MDRTFRVWALPYGAFVCVGTLDVLDRHKSELSMPGMLFRLTAGYHMKSSIFDDVQSRCYLDLEVQ